MQNNLEVRDKDTHRTQTRVTENIQGCCSKAVPHLQRVGARESALICQHLGLPTGPMAAAPPAGRAPPSGHLGTCLGVDAVTELVLGQARMLGGRVSCIILVSTCGVSTGDSSCSTRQSEFEMLKFYAKTRFCFLDGKENVVRGAYLLILPSSEIEKESS